MFNTKEFAAGMGRTVTVHTSVPFALPRAYVSGLTARFVVPACYLEPGIIVVTGEFEWFNLRLEIDRNIYAARSRFVLLHEIVENALIEQTSASLPAEFNVNVRIYATDEEGSTRINVANEPPVETSARLDFPSLPLGYLRKKLALER
jgi:hypothetical protein